MPPGHDTNFNKPYIPIMIANNLKTSVPGTVPAPCPCPASAARAAHSGKHPADSAAAVHSGKRPAARPAEPAAEAQGKTQGDPEWVIVRTPTFEYLSAQLELCRANSLSGMFCDIPNIGKTVAARHHALAHPHVVYVDCAQVKTKQRLMRFIARGLGLDSRGRYADVYDALVGCLRTLDHPQIILDEAGDLAYDAFLEIKAAWNATEGRCSWYLVGADGFRAKLERGVEFRTVGFAEIRSRCGDTYHSIAPCEGEERRRFLLGQAMMVARANAPERTDYRQIARRSDGSLRRVWTLITKGQ